MKKILLQQFSKPENTFFLKHPVLYICDNFFANFLLLKILTIRKIAKKKELWFTSSIIHNPINPDRLPHIALKPNLFYLCFKHHSENGLTTLSYVDIITAQSFMRLIRGREGTWGCLYTSPQGCIITISHSLA